MCETTSASAKHSFADVSLLDSYVTALNASLCTEMFNIRCVGNWLLVNQSFYEKECEVQSAERS